MKENRPYGDFMSCEDHKDVQLNKIVTTVFSMYQECFQSSNMNIFRLYGVYVVSGIVLSMYHVSVSIQVSKISFRNLCLQTTYTVYACVVMHCTFSCLHRYIRSPFSFKQLLSYISYICFSFVTTMGTNKGAKTTSGTPPMRSTGDSASSSGIPPMRSTDASASTDATPTIRSSPPPPPTTPAPSNAESRLGPWKDTEFSAQYFKVLRLLEEEGVPEAAFKCIQWNAQAQPELNNTGYPVLSKERLMRDEEQFQKLSQGKPQQVKAAHDTVSTVVLRPEKLAETLQWDRDQERWNQLWGPREQRGNFLTGRWQRQKPNISS